MESTAPNAPTEEAPEPTPFVFEFKNNHINLIELHVYSDSMEILLIGNDGNRYEVEIQEYPGEACIEQISLNRVLVQKKECTSMFPSAPIAIVTLYSILRQPGVKVDCFYYRILNQYFVRDKNNKTEHAKWDERSASLSKMLKAMMRALMKKLEVEVFKIVYNGKEEEVMCLLPYLEPGHLRRICLFNPLYVSPTVIDNIITTEQWKQAKELNTMTGEPVAFPVESHAHFESLRIRIPELKQIDIILLVLKYLNQKTPKDNEIGVQNVSELFDFMWGSMGIPHENDPESIRYTWKSGTYNLYADVTKNGVRFTSETRQA